MARGVTRRTSVHPSIPSIPESTSPSSLPTNAKPACRRHTETVLAASIWTITLPVLLSVPGNLVPGVGVILVMLTGLLVFHAFTLRPFCTDVDGLLAEEGDEEVPKDEATAEFDQQEELKLMLTCCVFLSAVGAVVCLSSGGYTAFKTWLGSSAERCTVTDLEQLRQQGYSKFLCRDGFLDDSRQASLLATDDTFRGGTVTYRLAPILSRKGASPVAWGISRDHRLIESPCKGPDVGLCGIVLPPLSSASVVCSTPLLCLSPREKDSFVQLRDTVTEQAKSDEPDKPWHTDGIPLVWLTDPKDPEGNLKHLVGAVLMWGFTLAGFLGVLGDLAMEECSKARSSYERLRCQQAGQDDGHRLSMSSSSDLPSSAGSTA